MIEVRELNNQQIEEFIAQRDYGHLACCSGGEPYVVPIHYAYQDGYIYIYTTQGKKSELIGKNPRICLQIEDVKDNRDWTSVIVYGEALELTDEAERAKAVEAVANINPTLTPAVSVHWMDNWVRENIEVVYRIIPVETTGRIGIPNSESRSAFIPPRRSDGSIL
jgi:nitroimidazol reductase NimA-like FMN-containing flavoprotein (pyridoxamine 5'-phosphate oxidase superfamily)